ncbi:MAG: LON peptidase substrate-binding domain-containing protein [Nitrospirae bacterium]|nr:LON peptidase substrate-binding domain-containing protein [Nitrospirota bacterium]
MQIEHDRTPSGNSLFHVPDRFPIFPLPNVVLFPRLYLPLHIFEPRYRRMVTDVASGGRCIGMTVLKEGWEQDYYGNPPIFDVGCVGRLVTVQTLPDGRFDILLQGLHRFEVRDQFYEKGYREAKVALKPDQAGAALDPAVRAELVHSLKTYLSVCEAGLQWQGLLRQDVDDEIFVNSLSTYLDLTSLEKQFLLEADGLLQQARRLNDFIQFKLDERGSTKGWS